MCFTQKMKTDHPWIYTQCAVLTLENGPANLHNPLNPKPTTTNWTLAQNHSGHLTENNRKYRQVITGTRLGTEMKYFELETQH